MCLGTRFAVILSLRLYTVICNIFGRASMASALQESQVLSFCIFKPELGQKEGKVGERRC